MAAIGTLSIDLVAQMAKFEADMGKAARASEKTAQQIQASLGTIKSAFAALAGAVSVGVLVSAFQAIVDGADELGKLSQRTGIAVETLGGLGYAASLAGGSVQTVTDAADKLNRSLSEAAAGEKSASEAFKVLGLSATDAAGRTKSVDVAFAEIADKFATYKDGPEKVALAMRLFGKAGAEQIVLLNQGGDAIREQSAYYQRFSGVTQELTQQAEKFNDTMSNIGLLSSALGTNIVAKLLPSLQVVADEFLRMKEEGDGFAGIGDKVKFVFDRLVLGARTLGYALEVAGLKLGAFAAQSVAFAQLDFKGISAISDAVAEDVERATQAYRNFGDKLLSSGVTSAYDRSAARLLRQGAGATGKVDAPRLPGSGADKAGAEVAKLQTAYESFLGSLRERVAAQQVELTQGRAATESEKLRIKFVEELGDKLNGLSVDRQVEIDAQINALTIGEKELEQRKRMAEAMQQAMEVERELADARVDQSKAFEAISQSVYGYVQTVREETDLLQLQQSLAGRSEQDRAVAIAQYKIQLDLKRRIVEIDSSAGLNDAGRAALRAQATAAALEQELNATKQANLDASKSLADSIEDGIMSGFRKGHSVADIFLRELEAQFAKTILRPAIQPLAEYGNKLIGNALSGLAGLFSFDGGGYTGSGARSGGVDGKGGFLSVLHPQETVIDHSKGQRGGSTVIQQSFTVGDVASMRTVRKAIAQSQQASAAALQRSQNYGGAMA